MTVARGIELGAAELEPDPEPYTPSPLGQEPDGAAPGAEVAGGEVGVAGGRRAQICNSSELREELENEARVPRAGEARRADWGWWWGGAGSGGRSWG